MICSSARGAIRSLLVASATVFTTRYGNAAPSAAEVARAETLFESGKAALASGDLATACARLDESQRLDPAVGTLLNLATCEERSGRLAVALEHFTLARAQLTADDYRVRFTREQMDSLAKRVAHLVIRVPAKYPAAMHVARDGAELTPASFNVPIVVDPGSHVLVVEGAVASPSRIEVGLAEGETKTVDVTLIQPGFTPPSTQPGPAPERPSRTLGYVALGVGAAGVIAGTITGVLTLNAAGTYRDHCARGECDSEGLSAASTGRTVSIISPIAFAVGAVGLGLGTYMLLSAPHARPPVALAW
jgi:hypothetical protein